MKYLLIVLCLLFPGVGMAQSIQGNSGMTPLVTNQTQIGGTAVVADPCQALTKTFNTINIVTAANTKIVTGTSAKKTYVCSIFLLAGAADNVAVVGGTGTNCGTTTVGLVGGATAATGLILATNSGWQGGNGVSSIFSTTVNADDFCLITSAAVQLSGVVATVQQ